MSNSNHHKEKDAIDNTSDNSEESIKSKDFNLKFMEYDLEENEEDDKSEKEEDLPEKVPNQENAQIRCAYCGITHISHLIKCNECNRWFCNGKLDKYSASHIVFHLTKSKHKEIYISKESLVGEMVMECYTCSCKNIFLLGFLESKEGDSGFIICREPCLSTCKIDDSKFEKTNWVPLINEKKILDWIVPEPTNEIEIHLCHRVNIRNMSKFEEKWEKDKLLESQEKPKFLGNYLKAVKLSYNDGQDYLEIFEPLISAEEEYDKKLKETQKKTNIMTKFHKSGRKVIAKFMYPREDNEIKLVAGDELKMTDPRNNKSYRGFVVQIELDDIIHLELEKCEKLLQDGSFIIEFVWKGTSFKRMLDGLYTFVNDETSVSNYIYSKLLGHNVEEKKLNYTIPSELGVAGLPELNYFQKLGIKKALTTPLFLIQGPPGTGKSVTSAAIVYHLVSLKVGKVLVCAPSNIAADQLSEKIKKIGLNVVRVCAKSRESISSNVEHLTLHNLIRKLNPKEYKKLFELLKKKEEEGIELSKSEHDAYKKLKSRAEAEILNSSDVVVTTCIASFDKRLNNYRFPIVLIDEATQACESECILPLLRGAKHAILVGDHCQLGPVVLCKSAAKAGLKMSLFERLVKLKIKPHMLQVQYRMHPKLSEFPSNTFYYGNLQNGISAEERIHFNVNFPWPNQKNPTFFYHIIGQEEFSASGTSYLNRQEADFIEKVVTNFLRCSVKPDQIGIITPYEGQRCYLLSHMMKTGIINTNLNKEIEVASVDSFQGREKDYIILSCVRSNDHHGIGFLDDPRRLNVSLTRARYGLVIVGNALSLSRHQLWVNLLNHYKLLGLLVEGNLSAFKEYMINLPKSKRYIPEKMAFEQVANTTNNPQGENNTINSNTNVNNNNDSLYSENVKKADDIFNNATVSRFSDFGYTNESEGNTHFNMVYNHLKVRPLRVNNEFNRNFYDKILQSYNAMVGNAPLMMNMGGVMMSYPMMANPMVTRAMIPPMNKMPQMMDMRQTFGRYGLNYYKPSINEGKFVLETEF